ncbi:MAG: inositol monophosphatase family protein [Mariprofundaceae bacterium]
MPASHVVLAIRITNVIEGVHHNRPSQAFQNLDIIYKESRLTLDTTFSDNISSLLKKAGETIIMPAFLQQACKKDIKEDGSVVTETDLTCQHFLQTELQTLYPDVAFLGEEMSSDEQLACLNNGGRFWCVDPLDGTSNFTIPFPHFASSLALIEDGRPVFACIHDPILDETFTAIKDGGAFLNNAPIKASTQSELTQGVGFIDFKRLDQSTAALFATKKIFRSQRNIGTCALEWSWLAAGRAHFIIHGGEKIWDYSAGSLLAQEAGAVVSDFENRDPFHTSQLSSSILATANSELHRQLLQQLTAS